MNQTTRFLLFLWLLIIPFCVYCQKKPEDISLWTWVQIYRQTGKRRYASIQYQIRLDNNINQFSSCNYYFMNGYNLKKNTNIELLYQLNSNSQRDLHTFYAGLTQRIKFDKWVLYARTAFQHSRYYFSSQNKYDRPFNELRNRLRIKYQLNKTFEVSIAAEPTIRLASTAGIYVDKIRYLAQTSINYNKYQSLTLFYIYQPDIFSLSVPEINFVIGITYQLNLPSKIKKYKKIFKPHIDLNLKREEDDGGSRDLL